MRNNWEKEIAAVISPELEVSSKWDSCVAPLSRKEGSRGLLNAPCLLPLIAVPASTFG